MAIYHLSAKVISRASGRSAIAAAAYRSASELPDARQERSYDFTAKTGVVHSEILLPEGAPERLRDRATLWNEVEAGEKRRDAQLAREVEFSIPREMTRMDSIALARDFVRDNFVGRGMVADLNVHWDHAPDGSAKPHAHVMLSLRSVGPEGFGQKVREWNATKELVGWRERWGEHVNARLAELGIDASIDHRSLKDQGLTLEPQGKIGPAGARRSHRGEDAERAGEHHAIARRNGERLLAEPELALRTLTHHHASFTEHDLARLMHRHSDGAEQFGQVMAAVRASPEMVRLGEDGRGRERFTTREMIAVESRMAEAGAVLAERGSHAVSAGAQDARLRTRQLGDEQETALLHVTGGGDLALVVGFAGTGKSTMLGAAREVWEAQGYSVRGATLSGIAAENLEAGSGIGSRTLASLEHAWGQGREELTGRDVLVIDEAGIVGSRQMERVLSRAAAAGAKVVLVGDPEQLQAIEAGAAFRALAERHGAAEITTVRRQHAEWQRAATKELATGRTGEALGRYAEAGMVEAHPTRSQAREATVAGWDAARGADPAQSSVMLAYTRADVGELNGLARARLREAGDLGEDHLIGTERGERSFAAGDRLMFLRNERGLGVKNGTLGTVERVNDAGITVRLDGADARLVAFDVKDYAAVDHGYAATVHKAQGVTVDRAYVLASPHMDRHAAYVGLTRHRASVSLHYGRDDFRDGRELAWALGRERAKDTTLDYATGLVGEVDPQASFAERRGIVLRSEIVVPAGLRERAAAETPKSGHESTAGRLALAPGLDAELSPPHDQGEARWLVPPRVSPDGRDSLGRGLDPASIVAVVAGDRALERERKALGQYLDGVYRDPPEAQARLNGLVQAHGFGSAAQRLAADPGQLGELQGRSGFLAGQTGRKERARAERVAAAVGPAVSRIGEAEARAVQAYRGSVEARIAAETTGVPRLSEKAQAAVEAIAGAQDEPGKAKAWTTARTDEAVGRELAAFSDAVEKRFGEDGLRAMMRAVRNGTEPYRGDTSVLEQDRAGVAEAGRSVAVVRTGEMAVENRKLIERQAQRLDRGQGLGR